MVSPICTVNGESVSDGHDVSPGDEITIALVDTTGVNIWSLTCYSTDLITNIDEITGGILIDQSAKTATLTMPTTTNGSAILLKSVVNNGYGYDGKVNTSYTDIFGVYALGNTNRRLVAVGQTTESNEEFGWVEDLNMLLSRNLPSSTLFPSDIQILLSGTLVCNNLTTTVGPNVLGAGIKYSFYEHASTDDYYCDAVRNDMFIKGSASFDIYLPPPTAGRMIIVFSDSEAMTVQPNSSEEVNHAAEYSFAGTDPVVKRFISDGTNWYIPSPA